VYVEEGIKLDFDDVLLRPKRSRAPSRKDVDLIRTFECLHGDSLTCLPIIAANMSATGTFSMAKAFEGKQALVCLHKFYDVAELEAQLEDGLTNAFYTLGIRDKDFEKLAQFARSGILNLSPSPMICLDAANGYTMYFVRRLQQLREMCPNSIIMAGNVATPEMVQELLLMGADIVKIGIGPGSVCTTRIETGVGYPQLSAVIECADAAHGLGGLVCADGGCKTPGDVTKAFAAGADFVMLGGMLAGCDECEGEWIGRSVGKEGLKFYGMSSREAQEKFYDGVPEYATAEGKSIVVPAKGPAKQVLKRITGGLRSACAYVGAECLKDLTKCATFIKVNRIHS
jgi:GMP reductase